MSTQVDFRFDKTSQSSKSTALESISDLLKKELHQLDQEIDLGLQIDNQMINQIGSFIWNSGGKRIRPIMVFLSSRLCDYSGPKDVGIAAAVRLLRPGGRLIVVDLAPHGEEWVREKLGHQHLGFAEDRLTAMFRSAGLEQGAHEPVLQRRGEVFRVILASAVKPGV